MSVRLSGAIRRADVWRRTGRHDAPIREAVTGGRERIEGAATFLRPRSPRSSPDNTFRPPQAVLGLSTRSCLGRDRTMPERFFDRQGSALKKNRARLRARAPKVAAETAGWPGRKRSRSGRLVFR